MPPISLLIKPASSNCNLRCKYCFYQSLAGNRSTPSYGMMSLDTLEMLVKKALEYADVSCTFAFQGGEPTLAGLEFYRKLIEFVNLYNVKKVKVHYALQTNGILMDDEWAEFLKNNNFLVGLSIDGTKDIHDLMRIDAHGRGTYQRSMKTVELFNRYSVEYNILCVVNNYVARHIKKIYSEFKKNNFQYLQFIPCLDPLDEAPGGYEHSLTPLRYANFLNTLFDLWYEDIMKGNRISIRYFDNLVGMIMGYAPESCGMAGFCTAYFVVEADGGVYPCDFYVIDQWKMGNIKQMSFEQLRDSENAALFTEISRQVDPKCKSCKWYRICRGGCRRDREPFKEGLPALNRYCSSFEEFFTYAADRLVKIAQFFNSPRSN